MSPELPQELVDQIIDHLWDDPLSLRACSLSCSAWLPSSRTHIFREVKLDGAVACLRFEELLQASSDIIAVYIRNLFIEAHHFSYNADALRNPSSTWVARIPSLLERLPRVIELGFTSLNWSALRMDAGRSEMLCNKLADVRHLHLSNVHFETSAQAYSVLSAAKKLAQLRFDRVYWNCWSPTSTLDSSGTLTPSPLRRLLLQSGSPPNLVIDWLLSSYQNLEIRDLCVRWRERGNTRALGGLLRAAGPRLEHLYIEFTNGVASATMSRNDFSLAHNTMLRALHIDGLVLPGCDDWLASILCQLNSRCLEVVEISILARRAGDLYALDWPQLETAFSRLQLPGLSVTFNISLAVRSANDQVEAHKTVGNALPSFQERGTLLVKCT